MAASVYLLLKFLPGDRKCRCMDSIAVSTDFLTFTGQSGKHDNHMIQFQCDYSEGAHPLIMERLLKTNMEQTVGYGMDSYCSQAAALIRKACAREDADVHFLVGGTQTNMTVISAALRPYQGVICADTGHINVHETGAVEHTGHKVIALPGHDGLLSAGQIEECIRLHYEEDGPEHCVQPGMVYLSFSSELGTVYPLKELEAISGICRRYGVILFIDGARLGYALASPVCDVTLEDIARLSDVFYIGGTKQGALIGEALVVTGDNALRKDFRYSIKQNGGMLAKGRLLGIQFMTLFEDGLYMELSRHAVAMALEIKEAFASAGFRFLVDSYTNQQFVLLTDDALKALSADFMFSVLGRYGDGLTAVRFCTSWATGEDAVRKLADAVARLA